MIQKHLFTCFFLIVANAGSQNVATAQAKPYRTNKVPTRAAGNAGNAAVGAFKLQEQVAGKRYLATHPSQLQNLTDDQFLERIQYDYTKLCLQTKDSVVTVEVDGYNINLLPVAAKNGWISRQVAAKEVLRYLAEFDNAKTIHGFFPRSFNRKTGQMAAQNYWTFGRPYDVYGTAVIAASLKYFIASYFNRPTQTETKIRRLCMRIVDRVDWNFAYNESKKSFSWFKNGENAERFDGKDLVGIWDETFFIQLLAMMDKKWKYGTQAYDNFVSKLRVDSLYGFRFYPTPQIGYAAQSFIWYDLEGYKDSNGKTNNLTYFESVRNAVNVQMAYASANPKGYPHYGKIWGIGELHNDTGDIQLEEVFSSLQFEPAAAVRNLRNIYKTFKSKGIYTTKGMHGRVNVSNNKVEPLGKGKHWFGFYLPLNVLYIENYRSGMLWKLAKSTEGYNKVFQKASLALMIEKKE